MTDILIPINKEEFNKCVKIRFDNINEGFNLYKSNMIEGSEEQLINFIEKAYELNGKDYSYVDFYYNLLDEDQKLKLKAMLDEEDIKLLEYFEKEYTEKNIYFKLTSQSIKLLTKLCTREILFSTFYFTRIPCTIWGNYNKKFPVFYEEEKYFSKYNKILEEIKK